MTYNHNRELDIKNLKLSFILIFFSMNIFALNFQEKTVESKVLQGLNGLGIFISAFDSGKKAPSIEETFNQEIINGRIDKVEELINSSLDHQIVLRQMLTNGSILATRNKKNDIAKLILRKAVELNIIPYSFEAPYWYLTKIAIETNNVEVLQELERLDSFGKTDFLGISACNEKFGPLKIAINVNNDDAISMLLSHGADFKCALDDKKVKEVISKNYNLKSFIDQLKNPSEQIDEIAEGNCYINKLNVFEKALLAMNSGNEFEATHRCYRREVFKLVSVDIGNIGVDRGAAGTKSNGHSTSSEVSDIVKPAVIQK